jgi:hypothetical protein
MSFEFSGRVRELSDDIMKVLNDKQTTTCTLGLRDATFDYVEPREALDIDRDEATRLFDSQLRITFLDGSLCTLIARRTTDLT